MFLLKKILHPTDFSETADQALGIARALARDSGARLVLLAVAPPPPPAPEPYLPADELEGLVAGTRRELTQLAAKVTDVPVDTIVESGDPASVIVQAARDTGADLIVMGTHGRTGLGRLLLGSVAELVVRRATCPVLTIKPSTGGEKSP